MNGRSCLRIATIFFTTALGGCFGTTNDATNITQTSARLNATGTCDTGNCDTYFEYWPADSSAEFGSSTVKAEWRGLPPGTYSFFDTVSQLEPNTSYQYRVCGNEVGQTIACTLPKSFNTLADAKIQAFTATVSPPNIITLRWDTNGGTVGQPLHIYGAFTDPVSGNYHRNVGFRNDHDNLSGLTFRVPPGTHRYVLELPTNTGKVLKTIHATVAAPESPIVTSPSTPLFPINLTDTTVSWQPLPAGQFVKISVLGKPPIPSKAPGENSHIFTQQYLSEVLGHGIHTVYYSACINMASLPTPRMNADFCSRDVTYGYLDIGSANFLGPLRHFVTTGGSVTLNWTATGNSTVMTAPAVLGGQQTVFGTSHTFYNLPPGTHDISLDSCTSAPIDCANTEAATAPVSGTVTSLVNINVLAELPLFLPGLGASTGQQLATIQPASGPEVPVLSPVKGHITQTYVGVGAQVNAGDPIFMLQNGKPHSVQIVVSDNTFVRRSWTEDFAPYWQSKHHTPDLSHVNLGMTMPLLATEDGSVWAAGEFAEGSFTHITGSLGNFQIWPLAAPVLNKPSGDGLRLVPVQPFTQPSLGNASLTKQETLIEAGQYIWLINGGSSQATSGVHNWNRIIRFDRAGTDFAATVHDDRFCVYHVPTDNAEILGIDWDEVNNLVWYVESRYPLSPLGETPVLGWFNPDELDCENFIDYGNPATAAVTSTTTYCTSPTDTGCIHTVDLIDWQDPQRKLIFAAHVKVESDAVWVAGYLSNNIARYDLIAKHVDVLTVNPPSVPNGFTGGGPWQFLAVDDDLYFTEFFDGDIVKLDKQALAADLANGGENLCKIPGSGMNNPCMSEIRATNWIKEIGVHENRLYFAGFREFGYINLDSWTPGKIYTEIEQLRDPQRARGSELISSDMSVGAGGMVVINDYLSRSVYRFYPRTD